MATRRKRKIKADSLKAVKRYSMVGDCNAALLTAVDVARKTSSAAKRKNLAREVAACFRANGYR